MSSRPTSLIVNIVLVLLLMGPPVAGAAPFALIDHQRSVSAYQAGWNPYPPYEWLTASESVTASDAGPFNESVFADLLDFDLGSAYARQTSTIGWWELSASSGVFTDRLCADTSNAMSYYMVLFELSGTTEVRIMGDVWEEEAAALVRLYEDGGGTVFEFCGALRESFDETHTLAPGTYRFTVHTESLGSSGFASANATLTAIPEPATLGLLALGACLPLFRRKSR